MLLRRKWLILVAVIVATGGVYALYSHKPRQYTASTLVFTQDPGDPVGDTGPRPTTDRSLLNEAATLYSQDVAAAVKERIGYAGTPSRLLSSVRIQARTGQDIIEISARAGDPRLVAEIVNGFAKEFVARSSGPHRGRVLQAAQVTRRQLRRIPVNADTRATRQRLGDRIRTLELALEAPATGTRQIDPAVAPTAAAAPKPARNAIFAFVLSLVLSVAAALGLERLDRTIKRPEEAELAYRMALLAVVPHSDEPAPLREGVAALAPDLLEPFRTLRTSIGLADRDDPARTIVVTSAIRGEGKSTVVRNLALAFAEAGKRVAVVEGDLRRPSLAALFGQRRGAGLVELLGGEKRLEEVALQVRTPPPGMDDRAGCVTLLLSGALPANPPAALSSARLREILDELRASHDITIVDSAPLLPMTDSVPLIRYADAAIVVSRLAHTTRDAAGRLVEFLDRVPDAHPIGLVANDVARFAARGYHYGPRHGYRGEVRTDAPATKVGESKSSDHAV